MMVLLLPPPSPKHQVTSSRDMKTSIIWLKPWSYSTYTCRFGFAFDSFNLLISHTRQHIKTHTHYTFRSKWHFVWHHWHTPRGEIEQNWKKLVIANCRIQKMVCEAIKRGEQQCVAAGLGFRTSNFFWSSPWTLISPWSPKSSAWTMKRVRRTLTKYEEVWGSSNMVSDGI